MEQFLGDRRAVGVLHMRVHSVLLLENPSGHEGAGYQSNIGEDDQQHYGLRPGQIGHGRSHRFLLH